MTWLRATDTVPGKRWNRGRSAGWNQISIAAHGTLRPALPGLFSFRWSPSLLRRLLLGEIADDRHLEPFALCRADDADKPQDEEDKAHQHGEWNGQRMQDEAQHAECKVQDDRGHCQSNALHGMKAYEGFFGVRLNQEEDDGRNKGEIRDRGCCIVG